MPDVAPSMPQNEVQSKTPHNRSNFPFSYRFLDTHRFGEVHPFMVMETVPKDHVTFRPNQDVRSYTMQAPLLEDVAQRRLLTWTPMQAILPNNWDKWYTNPVQGDDVPDDAGCVDINFWERVALVHSTLLSTLVTSSTGLIDSLSNPSQLLGSVLRFMVFQEWFYSHGSLMSSLGAHGAPRIHMIEQSGNLLSADALFDRLCAIIKAHFSFFTYHRFGGFASVRVDLDKLEDTLEEEVDSTDIHVSFRNFLSVFREDPSGYFFNTSFASGKSISTFKTALHGELDALQPTYPLAVDIYQLGQYTYPSEFNFSRLVAYQMTCAEYFTNDHVDYVYDSKLLNEYQYEIVQRVFTTVGVNPYFTANGKRYYYDAFSGYALKYVMGRFVSAASALLNVISSSTEINRLPWTYLGNIFSFRSSLRFKDYFTGSRTQPLAVDTAGDLSLAANPNVSVIDITKGIQKQRFLNAVNRSGRRMKEYVKELFGEDQRQDFDHPLYLAEVGNVVYGDEVSNTGAAQQSQNNSVTQTLRAANNNYSFEFDFDREGVFLAVNYYDIPRAYSSTTERQFFISNRFDHFNPYLQFVGDQPVFTAEIGRFGTTLGTTDADVWAYQNRDMQWKQRYNQVAGGFIENLPGWSFIADRCTRFGANSLSPDYIRSIPAEFDIFFPHLTGYSLGSYFHFIVRSTNGVEANRPMAYAPSIL